MRRVYANSPYANPTMIEEGSCCLKLRDVSMHTSHFGSEEGPTRSSRQPSLENSRIDVIVNLEGGGAILKFDLFNDND
jgi:hypothetical protein